MSDLFHARDTLNTSAGPVGIYRLDRLEDAGLTSIAALPYSIRVLLEGVLRNCDGYAVTEQDVRNLAGWKATAATKIEIPFKPARVILFGSYARGEQKPSSDIDVAVVADDFVGVSFEDVKRFIDVTIKKPYILFEFHTFNTADFESGNPFAAEIKKTGIQID